MTNLIKSDRLIYSMSSENKPALEVDPGSTVVFETCDCFQNQISSSEQPIEKLDWEKINPATGPLYVKGAEKGDTLRIEILKIDINDYGVMAAIPGGGIFGGNIGESSIKILPIIEGKAIFNDSIYIPCKPMIGVIGVVPDGDAIPNGEPGSHGGNMDNSKIAEGAVLYLPVFHAGALLAMGDLHAAMGDGEVMVTGIEIAGKVKVKIDLLKNHEIRNPILEYEDKVYTIASHEDLLQAVKISAEDMLYRVIRKLHMDINEAGMLLSAIGNTEICQVVDPKMTARFSMPKWVFK
ncbi:acetamidase/formamidase family protein [Lutispora saccharofermentans]|uniref:Acetamidase/formamidase family protein n=1 Tax=Lutispora saccharofermentans TaxID=3024236 RepID=A0ABT1NHB2_9FIRM|nr:acetamidase/formamidase family protein [Lutispora saccharofermentans]MCQ1530663.1 acetamidase/formamidase family protein [Lutispora saccharofermentans]